jgi:hypothetical protein
MGEAQYFGVCCHNYRAVTYDKCVRCKPEYGCVLFKSVPELVAFNKLIPPSMRKEPLPLKLWPRLWNRIEPQTRVKCDYWRLRWVSWMTTPPIADDAHPE